LYIYNTVNIQKMGCDWGMYAVYKITLTDKPSYEFIDFTGAVGIWLMSHEEDDEVYVQMDNWLKSCPPNTVIYENCVWPNAQGDIVYSTPDWGGASIQHSMSHVLDLLKYEDMSKVLKIEAFPYAERRF
jgi:hypothetical protein